jgi:hypothetical protein
LPHYAKKGRDCKASIMGGKERIVWTADRCELKCKETFECDCGMCTVHCTCPKDPRRSTRRNIEETRDNIRNAVVCATPLLMRSQVGVFSKNKLLDFFPPDVVLEVPVDTDTLSEMPERTVLVGPALLANFLSWVDSIITVTCKAFFPNQRYAKDDIYSQLIRTQASESVRRSLAESVPSTPSDVLVRTLVNDVMPKLRKGTPEYRVVRAVLVQLKPSEIKRISASNDALFQETDRANGKKDFELLKNGERIV